VVQNRSVTENVCRACQVLIHMSTQINWYALKCLASARTCAFFSRPRRRW